MIAFDEAQALLEERVDPLGRERVSLDRAAGRWLAEDVFAQIASPRSHVSAMDGYAVRLSDLDQAPTLLVAGEARPGLPHTAALGAREAVRIFTGAPIPEGADCVIIQEYALRDGGTVRFEDGHGPSRHIRRMGHDFNAGDRLLAKGARLDGKALLAAASGDVAKLSVHASPRVSLLATGDELVAPGEARRASFTIPDSVTLGLEAMIAGQGGHVVQRHRAADDLPALERQAGELVESADLIVVTGGASVGEHDFAKPMFEAHGLELVFSKVAIKPGKPVWLGRVGKVWVLGLPGNPTSAMVTARLFLQPLLARLQGGEGTLEWKRMLLTEPLPATGDRETFARAQWMERGLRPLGNQDSGVQGGLARADWLIRCPPGQAALAAGENVSALLF
ncbi:molybdopterin molybdotransferase MoeA [Qipengyuania flava]|uniref:molybdopterin molybdotransferase MoeA n=1 Tax=Qipengyuania flava TaxID=192812 RepID=UPI001C62963E|nr:molybdopterin molybdotransferase MoeA [Qipengyuania flava]QYJ08395.1 molybdopterin molybdotransferase MoeA [Qipengyuania flava]